jgi:hypothetical protein
MAILYQQFVALTRLLVERGEVPRNRHEWQVVSGMNAFVEELCLLESNLGGLYDVRNE